MRMRQRPNPLPKRSPAAGALRRLCGQVGVPPIRFHDLRHLHNTVLMRGNINAGIIRQRAGHASTALEQGTR